MRISNRKLAQGFYRGLEIADPIAVLRQVDKIDKIGPDKVRDSLVNDLGLSDTQAAACVRLATISSADESFVDQVRALGVHHEELDEGLELLAEVVRTASRYVPGRLITDLKVARGLDYYTGTVYETELVGYESWGSISSGGRYDSLAADGRTTYPGVGLSIGVTRMLAPLFARGALKASRPVPTAVLVTVVSDEARAEATAVAEQLRRRGIACEVGPTVDSRKQIRYADRRGIPYVWFGGMSGGEVRDLAARTQVPADPTAWSPAPDELRPRVGPPTDADHP
jgi:histidyl-tRNA synthetase